MKEEGVSLRWAHGRGAPQDTGHTPLNRMEPAIPPAKLLEIAYLTSFSSHFLHCWWKHPALILSACMRKERDTFSQVIFMHWVVAEFGPEKMPLPDSLWITGASDDQSQEWFQIYSCPGVEETIPQVPDSDSSTSPGPFLMPKAPQTWWNPFTNTFREHS